MVAHRKHGISLGDALNTVVWPFSASETAGKQEEGDSDEEERDSNEDDEDSGPSNGDVKNEIESIEKSSEKLEKDNEALMEAEDEREQDMILEERAFQWQKDGVQAMVTDPKSPFIGEFVMIHDEPYYTMLQDPVTGNEEQRQVWKVSPVRISSNEKNVLRLDVGWKEKELEIEPRFLVQVINENAVPLREGWPQWLMASNPGAFPRKGTPLWKYARFLVDDVMNELNLLSGIPDRITPRDFLLFFMYAMMRENVEVLPPAVKVALMAFQNQKELAELWRRPVQRLPVPNDKLKTEMSEDGLDPDAPIIVETPNFLDGLPTYSRHPEPLDADDIRSKLGIGADDRFRSSRSMKNSSRHDTTGQVLDSVSSGRRFRRPVTRRAQVHGARPEASLEPSEVIPAESGARFRAGVARTAVVARTGAGARTDVAAQTGVVARTGVLARGRAGEVPNPISVATTIF